jgi:hypothetical protein
VGAITPESASRPTRDKPFLDADRQQRKTDFFLKVVKLVPLKPRPPLDAKPLAASQP